MGIINAIKRWKKPKAPWHKYYEKNEKKVKSLLEVKDGIDVHEMYCEIMKAKTKR